MPAAPGLFSIRLGGFGLAEQGLFHLAAFAHIGADCLFLSGTFPLPPGLALASGIGRSTLTNAGLAATADQLEIDLALIQVDTHYAHLDAVAQAEATSATLTGKAVMQRVEVVVITRHRRHVNQSFDVDIRQLYEQTKAGYCGDDPREALTFTILHELALEPVDDIASRLVGATLGHRTLLTKLLQSRLVIRIDTRLGHRGRALTAHMRSLATRTNNAANGAMDQQVRIAPDWRGEVRISLIIEAEMPVVVGAVDRLTERAQHHRLNYMEIRSTLDMLQKCLIILGRRPFLALVQSHAKLAEESPQLLLTL